jgi:hypothetical protein
MQTTTDLIKILPFTESFKENLLAKFDSLSADQRFSLERIVWDLYDALYEARLDENMQLAFDRAKHNEEKLDHDFYTRVRKQTEKELRETQSTAATDVDLSHAREKLQELLHTD